MGLFFSSTNRPSQKSTLLFPPGCWPRSTWRVALAAGLSAWAITSAATAAQLVVTWEDGTDEEDGYRVERSVEGVNFATVATLPANSTSYTDTSVLGGTTYWYRVIAFNAFTTSSYSNVAYAATPPEVFSRGTHSTSRLANLSVRAMAGTGDGTLIVGFVVAGASKSMLVRVVGPGLAAFASSTMADPSLTLMNGTVALATNDNWGGTSELKAAFNRLGAFGLTDDSLDAAMLRLLNAQPYTAIVSGNPGVALAEIYDADAFSSSSGRLANVSARARAVAGDGVLIVGFVISGDSPLPVLIRAVGPSLVSAGVSDALGDPQVYLYRGAVPLKYNDDWGGDAALTSLFSTIGASNLASANSKDAAIFSSLAPGAYTAIVSGVGYTSGVAVAEVYEVP